MTVQGGPESFMPTREESKALRRRAIVRAARNLMQQTGQAGFSMRALADQAGVSIATPYNLFGSKQSVMFAVLDADLEQYQEQLERIESDELDVFFEAVSLGTALYAAEPGFYRAVLYAAYNDGGTDFRVMFSGPRHAMWRRLVNNAVHGGVLRDEVEPNSFAVNLGHIYFSCLMEWVNGLIALEELEARVQYGFALSLRGMAMPAYADRLQGQIIELQDQLKSLYRARAGQRHQPVPRAAGASNGSG